MLEKAYTAVNAPCKDDSGEKSEKTRAIEEVSVFLEKGLVTQEVGRSTDSEVYSDVASHRMRTGGTCCWELEGR